MSECLMEKGSLLGAQNGILAGFCDAKFHYALGRNLNLLARGGITTDAGGSIHED